MSVVSMGPVSTLHARVTMVAIELLRVASWDLVSMVYVSAHIMATTEGNPLQGLLVFPCCTTDNQ